MKLKQYAYFEVRSDTLDPGRLTDRIGVKPDEISVRGSRHNTSPRPVPRSRSWKVKCDEPRLNIGAQVQQVIGRVAAVREAIRELLAEEDDARAQLTVVRYFGDAEGQEEVGVGVDSTGAFVREGIWLFGWHLDQAGLEFLAYVGADLDVDEYDLLQDESAYDPV